MIYKLLFLVVLAVGPKFALSDCGVVSRKEWGGLSPRRAEFLPRPLKLVIIQHTASPTCTTDQGCLELVRNLENYFLEQLHYWDIGPSFLIGGNGKVYEGPGWLHVGAHTYGYNRRSIGISFIGNFNSTTIDIRELDDEPTPAALAAARALVACGAARGHLTGDYKLVAHRQLAATESPGRKLYAAVRRWPDWTDDLHGIKNQ